VCLRAMSVPEMSETPVGTTSSRASFERRSIDPIVGVVGLIVIARNGIADPLDQDMIRRINGLPTWHRPRSFDRGIRDLIVGVERPGRHQEAQAG
jgi:hypothetical protein